MALLRKPPDKEFLAVEILCKIGHESAAGNIWIRPFSTDILSDPVDDENIDMVKLQPRKQQPGLFQKLVIPIHPGRNLAS